MTTPSIMILCALLSTVSFGMAHPPAEQFFPYNYTMITLGNGLRAIIIPMPSNGLVAYYSIVRTGSRDEWEPGHSGFAHFFEHMMFRGTKNFPADKYDKLITEMGADANAYTTDDYTAYHLSFTSGDLEQVIRLESDRFQNLFYQEAAFQTESGAVYGEYRKGKTNPWELLSEKLQETAFTKHTYRHTTIGFEADIKAMPTMYEYSKSFFQRYYRPENIVLVIVGDVKKGQTETLLKKYYGAWKKGYIQPKIEVEPAQNGEREGTVSYPGKTLPLIAIMYKGERYDPSNRSMVAALLLGELAFGENSELNKRLTLKEQKVQLIAADFGMNRDPNLWGVYSMVKQQSDVPYVRGEVYKTLEVYKSSLVAEKKLQDLKSRLKYSFLMDLDTPEKVAGNLARFVALTGGIETVDQLFAAYEKVTPQDIQDAARKFFLAESRTVITLTGSK